MIDLAKTGTYSRNLSPLELWMNFSEKSCKKWLTSRKPTKKHLFGKNWQPLKQTTTFRGFNEILGQKLEKVARFMKNHEKSSIWLKLAFFRANYHVFEQPITFRHLDELFGIKLQKVAHLVKNHEKSSI